MISQIPPLTVIAEFPVMGFAGGLDGGGSVLNPRKRSKIESFPVLVNVGHILAGLLEKVNSLESRGICGAFSPVELILRNACVAKVCDPVVAPVSVDVVNNTLGPRAVRNKPSKTMTPIYFAGNSDAKVSRFAEILGRLARPLRVYDVHALDAREVASGPVLPNKNPCFRAVVQAFADKISRRVARVWVFGFNFFSGIHGSIMDAVRVLRLLDTVAAPDKFGICFSISQATHDLQTVFLRVPTIGR
jgi:hypothetical protein